MPVPSLAYTLSAPELQGSRVALNRRLLALGLNDTVPVISGAPTPAGELVFEPASITFLALARAGNKACY